MNELFGNVFTGCPSATQAEQFEDLLKLPNCRIERIVSAGQTTPSNQPYKQLEDEWVLILQGEAEVTLLEPKAVYRLTQGDHLFIPAGRKHLVTYTQAEPVTIWLAVFSGVSAGAR
ncbi:cupin domain-containing protein [Salinibius halmophilus]|uniref:cupin domain-containing protein n=1 Tax=Salinibius halmophilus TaxID=1853216 RepID=UPI000E662702|nr:cupin domain-containing protein [Salinibius halmophilus]